MEKQKLEKVAISAAWPLEADHSTCIVLGFNDEAARPASRHHMGGPIYYGGKLTVSAYQISAKSVNTRLSYCDSTNFADPFFSWRICSAILSETSGSNRIEFGEDILINHRRLVSLF